MTTPNGCRWCGLPKPDHYRQWKSPVGWHSWSEPTDAQRKERMLARRAEATKEKLMTNTNAGDVEETCGDCIEGRCHWGGDGPLPGEECGCERHEASVRARTI